MSFPILVVEDRRSLAAMLVETLEQDGFQARIASRGDEAIAILRSGAPLLAVLTDLKLPGADGLAVLEAARDADPGLPVFLITAFATVDTAVAAIKAGARDYFPKPLDMERVLRALRAACEPRRAVLEPSPEGAGMEELVGSAPAFVTALTALRRVAATDAGVLLEGPSGSGKELFARALHRLSPRCGGPFVAFNCAAVPETLVEAELFGHERGAFTGATARHVGRFEQADKGTLLLDEVGEVPMPTQVKLLRALEDHHILRLGGAGEVAVDVRVVAASNRDLRNAVEVGQFRRDLYHRLCVFPIALPALTDRVADIPALTLHLLARGAERHHLATPTLRPAALAALVLAPWPGNVRELANLLERVAILAADRAVEITDLGLDRLACREGLSRDDARDLAWRLAGDESAVLARFLGISESELSE